MGGFFFVEEKKKNGGSLLVLINKQEFMNVVASHKNDFGDITLSSTIMTKLQSNDFLMGILLGYGRENAWLYYRKNHCLEKIQLTSFVEPQEHERFSNYVVSKGIWGFATGSLFTDLSQWPLPGFAVDPEIAETKSLKKKYNMGRQKLIACFDRRNFLDATLELLTQPSTQFSLARISDVRL